MAIPIQSQIFNPITGVFGTGQMQIFSSSGTWTVPPGIGKVRVRMWGAGGPNNGNSSNYGGGGGGGFTLKTIYDLTGVTSVAVTVGVGLNPVSTTTIITAGTSSFGSYCSATGGSSTYSGSSGLGGTGIGGDINTSGGSSANATSATNGGGGGCGSIFGNGGNCTPSQMPAPSNGGAGAGQFFTTQDQNHSGGNGFLTNGGVQNSSTTYFYIAPQSLPNNFGTFSIDFIGTGSGGASSQSGLNGGGGGVSGYGGYPGGGSGYGTSLYPSPNGLVIVEW